MEPQFRSEQQPHFFEESISDIIGSYKDLQVRVEIYDSLVRQLLRTVCRQQNIGLSLEKRLRNAQSQLSDIRSQSSNPITPSPPHRTTSSSSVFVDLDSKFIMSGTWAAVVPGPSSTITEAEDMVRFNRHQLALVHLDTSTNDLQAPPHNVNALLLKANILRMFGDVKLGLAFAEWAVFQADRARSHALVCKAQMYRGLCLLDLGWYAEASWCFTRAANVMHFGRDVAWWKQTAEELKRALPLDHGRRRIRASFKTIPELQSLQRLPKVNV